jgi:hypothetical protein
MRYGLSSVAFFALSCGPAPQLFIANDSDFDGYKNWEKIEIQGEVQTLETDGKVNGHRAGLRTVYLNKRPKTGANEFEVGTIVIKDMPDRILAMVKHGGDYNSKGLLGWEYFEVFENLNKKMLIDWRGLGPRNGESYGPRGSSCNTCHGADPKADGILTPGFALTR